MLAGRGPGPVHQAPAHQIGEINIAPSASDLRRLLTVHDGRLIVSMYPQSVASAPKSPKGRGYGLDQPAFRPSASGLAQGHNSIAFSDCRTARRCTSN